MKIGEFWLVQDLSSGLFLLWGYGVDPKIDGHKVGYHWVEDVLLADGWRTRGTAIFHAERQGGANGVLRGPSCGCCGKSPRRRRAEDWHDRTDLRRFDIDGETHWRCERHVGRLPCCIEGCGKTFAMGPASDYDHINMCGAHWREAPKYMRDAVARVRKIAKRRGWDDHLYWRYDCLWNRCWRAIRERRAAPELETYSQAVSSSGPPPAHLIAELNRIGL